jgi:hypothetical protein
MPLRDSVIRVKGRVNNLKKRLILPTGYKILFLKRGGETKRLVLIRDLTSGAYVEYSNWRQQLVLGAAVNEAVDTTFPDDVAQTSYWACGVPFGPSGTIDVYGVDAERRDVVPPTSSDPEWKFYLTRLPRERVDLSTIGYYLSGGYWAEVDW